MRLALSIAVGFAYVIHMTVGCCAMEHGIHGGECLAPTCLNCPTESGISDGNHSHSEGDDCCHGNCLAIREIRNVVVKANADVLVAGPGELERSLFEDSRQINLALSDRLVPPNRVVLWQLTERILVI